MTTRYQKRHYEDVAAIVQDTLRPAQEIRVNGIPTGEHLVVGLAEAFAELFTEDNPLFSRERFLKACGLVDWV